MELVALIVFAAMVLSWFVLPSAVAVTKVEQAPAWNTADNLQVVGAEA